VGRGSAGGLRGGCSLGVRRGGPGGLGGGGGRVLRLGYGRGGVAVRGAGAESFLAGELR